MRLFRLLALVFVIGAFLTACSSSLVEQEPASVPPPEADSVAKPANQAIATAPAEAIRPGEMSVGELDASNVVPARALWPDGEVRLDNQGFVEVAVTPLNLNFADGTLNFNVGLNTHSVDLSMDLASLARLEADNGLRVQAILWDAPRGGHHVSGVLSFPSATDGSALLKGTSHLILTIQNVDVPERSFSWSLPE